jgi:biopolymer transport protein ExbB
MSFRASPRYAIRRHCLRLLALLALAAAVAAPMPIRGYAQEARVPEGQGPAVEEAAGGAPAPAAEAVPAEGESATADEEAPAAPGGLDYTLIQLVRFGGVVGYVIILLSVVAVALIVDYALLLRPKVLVPPREVEELRDRLVSGRYDDLAEPRASFVGAVMVAGAAERERGYEAVVKAMEDHADELTGRLLRRIEYLNMIANVAPMLGLLGTVIGMVKCFNQISVAAGGADPRLLAAGIFQALMTTVMGLVVAIPAFFAFSIFRNRVDALVAEATAIAEDLVVPLRAPAAPVRPAALAGRG